MIEIKKEISIKSPDTESTEEKESDRKMNSGKLSHGMFLAAMKTVCFAGRWQ